MRILWLTSVFPAHPNNDRNLFYWDPVQALQEMGVEVIVLHTPSFIPFSVTTVAHEKFPVTIKTHRYLSIPRHYFRVISNYFYLKSIVPQITKLNKTHRFDVIHAHGEICGLAAVAASKKLNIPSVVTIHGVDTCERKWKGLSGKMFCRVFNETNRIIYVGEPLQKYFRQIVNRTDHCRIVHNGCRLPVEFTGEKYKNNGDTIHIISVSNLHEGKGVDLTLLALAKLKEQGIDNWTYTIIGSGNQKKICDNIIKWHDLTDKIIYKENCLHDTVYSLLENADIFCLPSYREAFGIAYLEAMAHGLLTIGVRGQGPQAFIENGKTGFLVEPKDICSLINVLKLAISNFEDMTPIALAGKKYVLENFTWEKHAEKLMTIYREMIGETNK